jgi:hypothetical protein
LQGKQAHGTSSASTAPSSARITGSRKIANQINVLCARAASRLKCAALRAAHPAEDHLTLLQEWTIAPPNRSVIVCATIFAARGLPA